LFRPEFQAQRFVARFRLFLSISAQVPSASLLVLRLSAPESYVFFVSSHDVHV
jgi:hypothetical protein